jgi:diaminohydroxyphosphoribosylaminopyrimidine deaminase / 5-amino-6-(5-phosphoribosylamino)uracil reductase
MNTPDQDRYWMQRALELARRGIAVTSPNPAVGCVILDRAGQVAGEGWHEYDLLDHAEVVALSVAAAARGRPPARRHGLCHAGALQPHRPHPPCTEALIASGLRRVVAATIDPNPAVAGHGMEALRAAGIETVSASARPKRAGSTRALPAGASTSGRWC